MKKNNSPHAPRPTGKDAAKAEYCVVDAKGVSFGENLTYDQAWKRKEEVAGQRKSTTPRIKKQEGRVVAATPAFAAPRVRGGALLRPVPQAPLRPVADVAVATIGAGLPTYSEDDRVTAASLAAAAATRAAQVANAAILSEESGQADVDALVGAPAATEPDIAEEVSAEIKEIDMSGGKIIDVPKLTEVLGDVSDDELASLMGVGEDDDDELDDAAAER